MSKIVIVAAAAALALVLGVTQARAVIVDAAPTWPIPEDAPPAPPPIPTLPEAGETPPPATAISDPVQPGAVCGDWYRQSSYGGAWSGGTTWWEYQCTYEYPQCVGACSADWAPYVWIDYFYWDGSNAVFYGEFFWDSYYDSMYVASGCSYWWDAATSQWYLIQCPVEEPANSTPTASVASSCSSLSCTFDGNESSDSDGTIATYEWVFGDGTAASGVAVQHTYAQPGTYTVTLTVTDDGGAWDRDSTTVAVTRPNAAPAAAAIRSCSALSCNFDGSGSRDSDGAIVAYSWDFGDGSSGTGKLVQHTYAHAGTYSVSLTVTDDAGATATITNTVLVLNLTASGYKVKGVRKVDLAWNGPSSESFAVYRDGVVIATVTGGAYTDAVGRSGGSYVYEVCAPAMNTCSNDATVNF